MSDIKYAKLRTFNGPRAVLNGCKLTKAQRFISLRSTGLHTEIEFSDRYGGISWSATMMDDCKCCRFKMIGYSHPEYWDTVYIPVTAEEEALMFSEACRMAGLAGFTTEFIVKSCRDYGGPVSGKYAIKYDLAGVIFSFISRKRNWWKPHKVKVWCNEACAMVVMKVERYKNLLIFPKLTLVPHDLTPGELDMICRHYFRRTE